MGWQDSSQLDNASTLQYARGTCQEKIVTSCIPIENSCGKGHCAK
jgi:hypothetical protein